jgi:hypothetical protein
MIISLSNSLVLVTMQQGQRALYSVQPQHMNLQHYGSNLNADAIAYGEQIAHECDGKWYKPGGWIEITDHRTIALIERSMEA